MTICYGPIYADRWDIILLLSKYIMLVLKLIDYYIVYQVAETIHQRIQTFTDRYLLRVFVHLDHTVSVKLIIHISCRCSSCPANNCQSINHLSLFNGSTQLKNAVLS